MTNHPNRSRFTLDFARFNQKYGATLENTQGYTQDQLDEVNYAVWLAVRELDETSDDFKQFLKSAFDKQSNS